MAAGGRHAAGDACCQQGGAQVCVAPAHALRVLHAAGSATQPWNACSHESLPCGALVQPWWGAVVCLSKGPAQHRPVCGCVQPLPGGVIGAPPLCTNACTPPPGRAGQCVPQVCHAPSCGGGQQGLPRPVLLRCVPALEPGAAGSWETMGWVGCTQGQQHACRAAQQGCPWHTRFLCVPASLAGFMSKNRMYYGFPH